MLKILMLGAVLAVFQQWCGINVIFQYGSRIFADAGYAVSGILFSIIVTGVVGVLMTFLAIGTVDRWGRRALMLGGASGLDSHLLCHWMGLSQPCDRHHSGDPGGCGNRLLLLLASPGDVGNLVGDISKSHSWCGDVHLRGRVVDGELSTLSDISHHV